MNTSQHFGRNWLRNGVPGLCQRRILNFGWTTQLFASNEVQDTFLQNMAYCIFQTEGM